MTGSPWEAHVDEEALEQYAMGALGDEDAAPIEEHLLLCAGCQNRLAELDSFLNALRNPAAGTPAAIKTDVRRGDAAARSTLARRPVE